MNLLLDTNAAIFLLEGLPMDAQGKAAIDAAAQHAGVLVSTISAWELGMLVAKRRIVATIPPSAWLDRLAALPGVRLLPLSAKVAFGASFLPGLLPNDPADRMLVATARELAVPIVTRDRAIRAFAAAGHVQAIPC